MLVLVFLLHGHDTLFLTLDESIEIALETNLGILRSAELVEAAEHGAAAVRKGLGFKTDLNLDQTRDQSYSAHGAKLSIYNDLPWGGRAGINTRLERTNDLYFGQYWHAFTTRFAVTQDLIAVNLRRLDEQQAAANLAMSNLNHELTRREIIYDVSVIFFDWLGAFRMLRIRESALVHAEALLAVLREKLMRGLRVGGNIFEAETYVNQCKVNVILSRAKFSFKKKEFQKIANIDARQEIVPYHVLNMDSVSVPEMPAEIIACDLPRLRMYDQSIILNDLSLKRLHRERSVRISLDLDAGLSSSFAHHGAVSDNLMRDYAVGITAIIPIFDRGVARDREQQLKHQGRSLVYARENLRNEYEIEISQAIDNLRLLSAAASLYMSTLEIAQANVQVELDRFGKGLSQINDVIRAQNYYISAELDYIETMIAYEKIKAETAMWGQPSNFETNQRCRRCP